MQKEIHDLLIKIKGYEDVPSDYFAIKNEHSQVIHFKPKEDEAKLLAVINSNPFDWNHVNIEDIEELAKNELAKTESPKEVKEVEETTKEAPTAEIQESQTTIEEVKEAPKEVAKKPGRPSTKK